MKKLMIIMPVLLVVAGAAWLFKPKPKPPVEHKIDGEVYALHRDFLVNLQDGRMGKVSVALVLRPADPEAAASEAPVTDPPEGYGGLPQEPVIRDIVTDTLTGISAIDLTKRGRRRQLERRLVAGIERRSDVEAERVVFTDLVVQ